jgi:ubiquinone/menaquinone biosynthesis C-methylase UbiE
MPTNDTDADWELLGKMDPYWAVLTNDEFRGSKLGDESIQRFFESGEHYAKLIFQVIHAFVHHEFQPQRALDFGCGVGRVVFPLALRCGSVVGMDVSESMLAEARKNAEDRHAANVTWIRGDDQLSAVTGDFDLIHSYIVFQHIPSDRGLVLFERLLGMLRSGGVGVLHITYSMTEHASHRESVWPTPPMSGWRHFAAFRSAILRRIGRIFQRPKHRPKIQPIALEPSHALPAPALASPPMQMN